MSDTKRKMKPRIGWACVGSHGGIFLTAICGHQATIGRYQIYESFRVARLNAASDDEVVRVRITATREKGKP